MKIFTLALTTHVRQPITTLAPYCRIQLQDGTVLGFTGFDDVLTIAGEDYTPAPGMQPFAVTTSSGMAVDTTDVAGALDDDRIRPEDIQDGLWDAAQVEYGLVNWDDLSMGKIILRSGTVGEFRLKRHTHVTELRSKMQLLTRETGDLYAPDCQADLGDSRCKVDLAAFTVTGTVSTVIDQRTFTDTSLAPKPTGWYAGGVVTWLTGTNAGRRMEVATFLGRQVTTDPPAQVTLFLGMSRPIQPDDTYEMSPGCDKQKSTCVDKYANRQNYQGFDLPGIGQEQAYPDSTF